MSGSNKISSEIQNEAPISCNSDKNNFDNFDDKNHNDFDYCDTTKQDVKVQSK